MHLVLNLVLFSIVILLMLSLCQIRNISINARYGIPSNLIHDTERDESRASVFRRISNFRSSYPPDLYYPCYNYLVNMVNDAIFSYCSVCMNL